jgi:ADP-ribose pyrophosphatase YjhB (NUDIX family)
MNLSQPLLLINANNFEPLDYQLRLTAKVVLLNEKHEILLFPNFLIGGGVDEGESFEQALHREGMEEAGVKMKNITPIGIVIQYRDELKKKYEVHGFIADKVGEMVPSTTTQANELGRTLNWSSFQSAISYLENYIKELESGSSNKSKDSYQGRLYNAKTHLLFIKKAQEMLGF